MKTILALIAVLISSPVLAQTPTPVTAQSSIEMPPSTDHNVLLPDGTPKLMAYETRFNVVTSGCAPLTPQSLGKPTPTNNLILIDPWAFLGSIPANCVYTAYIVAIGQQGVEGPPTPNSDPFVRIQGLPPAAAGRPVIRP